jgi:uncharacterized protein YjbK
MALLDAGSLLANFCIIVNNIRKNKDMDKSKYTQNSDFDLEIDINKNKDRSKVFDSFIHTQTRKV